MSNLDVQKIEWAYRKLRPWVRRTPVLAWDGRYKDRLLGNRDVHLKMEFLQHSGSFKTRGAFNVMLGNRQQVLEKGVVAVSRGNHACAVSYAAKELGAKAKVVIPKDASARRIDKCRQFGAEVVLTEDVEEAFALGEKIHREEGCLLVHPFEGELIALGTAGIGKEFLQQVPDLEEIYVACGGGGLLGGISAYVKQVSPWCKVIGVEPEGAAVMTKSLRSKRPVALDKIDTIADSLAPPRGLPFSFGLCQKYVDEIVVISDREMVATLNDIYQDLTLVFEPAGVAALTGAVKHASSAECIGIILCGVNIALSDYESLLRK